MFVLASNHFRKCFFVNVGVWLRMENKFSGNTFQLTVCFSWFDPEMVWSKNFHFKPFPDSRAKGERDRTQITPWTQSPEPFDFTVRLRLWIAPRSHPSTSPVNPELRALRLRTLQLRHSTSTLNRTQIAPFDFVGEPRAQITPSTSSRSHPKIAPRQHQSHWDRNWEIVGFRWIWPYLTGFDEFFLVGFCFCVYLLRNGIIYLFRS